MKIDGYDEHEVAAICEEWELGHPIDVDAFLDRSDIPDDTKERVQAAGWRAMQAAIIIEVVKLHKQTKDVR